LWRAFWIPFYSLTATGAEDLAEKGDRGRILSVDTVILLGFTVTELLSNSLKHAFPGDRRGEIKFLFGAFTTNSLN